MLHKLKKAGTEIQYAIFCLSRVRPSPTICATCLVSACPPCPLSSGRGGREEHWPLGAVTRCSCWKTLCTLWPGKHAYTREWNAPYMCICIYVCIYVHIYICVYIYVYIHMYTYICISLCVCMCKHMCLSMYLCGSFQQEPFTPLSYTALVSALQISTLSPLSHLYQAS